jgi:hypothetical protein
VEGSRFQVAAVVAVVLLMVLGAALESWWRRTREKSRARAAVKRGLKGERDAEKLLKKLGYTLLARQAPASYGVLVDGEPQAVQLSADFLVELNGKKLVAEVKTGKAVKLEVAETRRQMLEYQLAFGVDALLLVDMEAKTVKTVRFPLPKAKSAAAVAAKRMTVRWAMIALVTGTLAWLLARPADERANAKSPSADSAADEPATKRHK